jgi:hypothetical protein
MIFQSQMEALRTELVFEGEMPASCVQVMSKVLSQNNSNLFLKNVGFQTLPSSKSVSSNESQLREQLAAEATVAGQGELDDLRKKIQDAGRPGKDTEGAGGVQEAYREEHQGYGGDVLSSTSS